MDASLKVQSVKQVNPLHTKIKPYGEHSAMRAKVLMLCCQEKLLRRADTPVPETDTGGQVEKTKVNGRTIVKELCKLTP